MLNSPQAVAHYTFLIAKFVQIISIVQNHTLVLQSIANNLDIPLCFFSIYVIISSFQCSLCLLNEYNLNSFTNLRKHVNH